MSRYVEAFRDAPVWLRIALIALGVLWVLWFTGVGKHPVVDYVPPKFEELEVAEGKISFTQRSKSSGGDIVLRLANGMGK